MIWEVFSCPFSERVCIQLVYFLPYVWQNSQVKLVNLGLEFPCPFHLSWQIYWHKVFIIFFIILFISVDSVVMPPLSFLILVTFVFFLFVLFSLARDLSILLIFLNQTEICLFPPDHPKVTSARESVLQSQVPNQLFMISLLNMNS